MQHASFFLASAAWNLGLGMTWLAVQQEAALLTGALAVIAMRLVSVRYGWKLPS